MNEITPEIAAYAAGFFDGEGHIAITFQKGAKRTHPWGTYFYDRYQLNAQISQCNPEPLYFMKKYFGGSSVQKSIHRRSYGTTYYRRYDWRLSSRQCEAFLRVVRPYLIVKAKEADVALEFLATIDRARRKTPTNVVEYRRELFNKMRSIRNAVQQP